MNIPEIWFGTEASLRMVLEAYERYLENPGLYPPKLYDPDDEEEYDPADELITIQDGIGLLKVSGPLVSEESYFDRYFGVASYPAIGRAVMKLADKYEAGEIHSIIHAFSTSGGDASGINQLSETMKMAAQRAPNTVSWTGTRALSAGYWLAAVNPSLRADKMAELGSIGAITTLVSVYERMKESGIDVKVVRAGKNKALNHPYEPLSQKGIEETQKKVDQLHNFFIEHVLSARPSLSLNSKDSWADGSTFFADEAISMGLADGPVIGLSSLASQLISSNNQHGSNRYYSDGDENMPKVAFPSEAERAQVASGVGLAQVPHEVIEDEAAVEAQEPAVQAADSAPEAQAAEPEKPVQAPSSESELVAFLRAELKDSMTQVMALTAERDSLKGQLASAQTAEKSLSPIVVEAIQRLQVGLGQQPMKLDGLPSATLAEQYNNTRDEFERRFPAGRRSLAETDTRKTVDLAESRLSLVK
jgi:ClpP class serine protease